MSARRGKAKQRTATDAATPVPDLMASNREHALQLLIQGLSLPEVARELKVNRTTVWKWTVDPDFAGRLRAANADVVERAKEKVRALSMRALDACDRCLDDDDGRVVMAAAKVILDRVVPTKTEVDVNPERRAFEAMTPEQQAEKLRELQEQIARERGRLEGTTKREEQAQAGDGDSEGDAEAAGGEP